MLNLDCNHPCCPKEGPCRRAPKEKKEPRQIKPYSAKRVKENKIYKTLRDVFLSTRPYCQIRGPGCTTKATCVHHTKGRGIYFLVVKFWKASCITCNNHVENKDNGQEIININYPNSINHLSNALIMRNKKIVAISWKYNNTTSYISEYYFRQADNKYLITGYTEKKEDAHDFVDRSAAKAILIRLHNPYDREYKIEPLTVKVTSSSYQDQRIA